MSNNALDETTVYSVSPIIRGWKYGLFNAFPSSTKCIFRRNRFGQPRDMLEQRIFTYSVYLNDNRMLIGDSISDNFKNKFLVEGNKISNISYLSNNLALTNGASSKKKNENDLYPVEVKFIKQELLNESGIDKIKFLEVDPSAETLSFNKNSYARSSSPYKEGDKMILIDEPYTEKPIIDEILLEGEVVWSNIFEFYGGVIEGTGHESDTF